MIDVVCKSCGDFYQVDDREAGFRVPCPGCKTPNRVPGGEARSKQAGATAMSAPAPAPAPAPSPPTKPRRPYLTHRSPLGIFLFVVFALSAVFVAATPLRRAGGRDGIPPDNSASAAVADGTGWLVLVISGSALMIGRRLDEMG